MRSSSILAMASSAMLAKASPLGLSLPPLPHIPGVTEALGNIVPPLPILQFPSAPYDSPPFKGSDIEPKKIGYFWTGSGDKNYKGKHLIISAFTSRNIH
jgi:hypothetical protein